MGVDRLQFIRIDEMDCRTMSSSYHKFELRSIADSDYIAANIAYSAG